MNYELKFSDGSKTEQFDSYAEFKEFCWENNYAWGHDGDIEDGGDSTMVWASEEDADNDNGANAIATVREA